MSQRLNVANTQALTATISGVNPSFSVSAWIKPVTMATDPMIACFTDGATRCHYLIVGSPGAAKLKVLTADAAPATSVADVVTGAWQHCVGVWTVGGSGSTRAVYLNNVKATNGVTTNANTPNTIAVGAQPAGTNVFNGLIAEVYLFTEALTDAQVERLYLGCPPELIGGQGGNNVQQHHRWHLAGGYLKDPIRGLALSDLASATVTDPDHPRVYR